MTKILLPSDGSAASSRALDEVLQRGVEQLELHLLNVQLPVDGNVRSFVDAKEVNDYHLTEGLAELSSARSLLEPLGVNFQQHVMVGHPAEQIRRFADENGFDEIVMGTHGRTGLLHVLMGSVAAEVSRDAKTKVTLVG
jgi:nucleotide-binding universal stress UspA family protein